MIITIHKYLSVVRMTWIQALEYKSNLFVGLFAIFSGLLIEYLVWKYIFISQGLEMIRGFYFKELLAFIFLSMIVGQLKSSWVTSLEMIDAIRLGGINKFLIRPVSFYTYHFMMFIGHNSLYYFSYTLLIIIFPFIFPGIAFSNSINIVGFILSIFLSIFLSYSMYYVMVCFTFWFHEVRSLVVAYNIANIILSGQIIPLKFFPEQYLNIIDKTPIPYLVHFPVSTAMNSIQFDLWLQKYIIGLVWCFIVWILGSLLYYFGIKQYGAYGA